MRENFVSRKDRIIASAIEIISESGLSSLSPKTLAAKENMPEEALYRYFAGTEEVLAEVIEFYARFDNGIRQTVSSKGGSAMNRLLTYLEAYVTYYENYYAIATLMLQYEELLHKAETREHLAWCIVERFKFIKGLFSEAVDNGEIIDVFTPEELAKSVIGNLMVHILSRRIKNYEKSFAQDYLDYIHKWIESILTR